MSDLEQQLIVLKVRCDIYKAAWASYHPLADYMQGLANAGKTPGELGAHLGDIAIRHMQAQEARIAELKAALAVAQELASVRALPTGKCQAVLLTEEQINAISRETDDIEVDTDGAMEFARAIEAAVLAANDLEPPHV